MVRAISIIFQHYLSVPFEDFTAKAISASGVLSALESTPSLIEEIKNVKHTIDTTSDDLYISLYVLDRWVNPKAVIDNVITVKVSDLAPDIIRNKYRNGRTFTKDSGSDYFIQRKLCEAIMIIHNIVMKNLKEYNVDFRISGDLLQG